MRRYVALAAVAAIGCFIAIWLGVPSIAKHYLEQSLGKRQFSDVMKEADAANRASLGKIGSAEILLDIPTDSLTAALGDELEAAANLADIGSGWKISLLTKPTVSFHPSVIRAEALFKLSNDDVGSATTSVQVDLVPSVQGNELVAVPYVTAISLSDVEVYGLHLPGALADRLDEAIGKSLDALNTKLPQQRVQIQLPDEMLRTAKAQPALYVNNSAVAVILGAEANSAKEIKGAYGDEFIKIAREILPTYAPGMGLIAVRPSGSPMIEASETMRNEAAAANLMALEATLGIDGSKKPDDVDPSVFSNLVMVSAEGRWLERRLKELAVNAIAGLNTADMSLDVKPENVGVTLKDGVVEATAAGTATIADGKLGIDFSLTAWGVLRPGPGGLIASYVPREIKVSSVKVAWANRGATLAIPYQSALGDVAARFIGKLPETPLSIPSIPMAVGSGGNGGFKLVTKEPTLSLAFTGRAVAITPARVTVFAAPSLDGDPPAVQTPAVAPDKLSHLLALATKAYQVLAGTDDHDSLSVAVTKAGFARLLQDAWVKLDPAISITRQSTDTFDAGEIQVIPGDASCGNPCSSVDQCGNVGQCLRPSCSNVCETVFGGGWNPFSHLVCREVCHDEQDGGCVSHIEQCVRDVTQCTTAWGSGLQIACEATLAAVRATDTTGLAKVSGGTSFDASAATMTNSRLTVAPDLTALDLAIGAGGSAGVDAWMDITWTDFGNLLACPSGRLAVHLDASATLETSPLKSSIEWSQKGDALKATFSFGKVSVLGRTSEGPLGKLITSNPGLMTCSLGQAVVGLTLVALPKLTQELLASAIRGALHGDDQAKMVAALIDGVYRYEVDVPPTSFEVPATNIAILDKHLQLKPKMSVAVFVMGTGALAD